MYLIIISKYLTDDLNADFKEKKLSKIKCLLSLSSKFKIFAILFASRKDLTVFVE